MIKEHVRIRDMLNQIDDEMKTDFNKAKELIESNFANL